MYMFKRLLRGVLSLLIVTGISNLSIQALSQSFGTATMWVYLAILAVVASIFALDERFDWGFSSALHNWAMCNTSARDRLTLSDIVILLLFSSFFIIVGLYPTLLHLLDLLRK